MFAIFGRWSDGERVKFSEWWALKSYDIAEWFGLGHLLLCSDEEVAEMFAEMDDGRSGA